MSAMIHFMNKSKLQETTSEPGMVTPTRFRRVGIPKAPVKPTGYDLLTPNMKRMYPKYYSRSVDQR